MVYNVYYLSPLIAHVHVHEFTDDTPIFEKICVKLTFLRLNHTVN